MGNSGISDTQDMFDAENKLLSRNLIVLNVLCLTVGLIYVIVFAFYTVQACVSTEVYSQSDTPLNMIATVMFMFLGFLFFAVGIGMNYSLKNYFPDLYKNYRCLLWSATFLLTIPLFVRAIRDFAY